MPGMIYERFSQFAAVFLATGHCCSVQTSKQSNLIALTERNLGRNCLCVQSFPRYLDSRGVLPHITMHQHHACPLRVCLWDWGGWRGIHFWKWDNLGLCHVMSFASIELSDHQSGQRSRCLRSPEVLRSRFTHIIHFKSMLVYQCRMLKKCISGIFNVNFFTSFKLSIWNICIVKGKVPFSWKSSLQNGWWPPPMRALVWLY